MYDASTGLMGFDDALTSLRNGGKCKRAGWKNRHISLGLNGSGLTRILVQHENATGAVLWLCLPEDLVAEDWEEAF